MTLYEYVGPEADRGLFESQATGIFAPVDRCQHGKYDAHEYFYIADCDHPNPCERLAQCPGAGQEDTT